MSSLSALVGGQADASPVPRQALTFLRLPLAGVRRHQLGTVVRLQLTQYMPPGPFAFLCRPQAHDMVLVWAWSLDAAAGRSHRSWPEPAADSVADGFRLVRRSVGLEAQRWQDNELRHSRWFAQGPDDQQWAAFVRGCGADPGSVPPPGPVTALAAATGRRGWIVGDNLPAEDPWQGWQWQVAVLLAGGLVAAAVGAHLQLRETVARAQQHVQALRQGREASMNARARFDVASTELQSLESLAPRLSQLELLSRVVNSGVFASTVPPTPAPSKPVASGPRPATAALPALAASAVPVEPRARLMDWDFRNGQLKLTLQLAERNVTLLDVTRRLEAVPGLAALRVGQDSSANTLSINARVPELMPQALAVDGARPGGSNR